MLRSRRRSDSVVISALSGPIVTLARFPSSVIVLIGPRIVLSTDESGASLVETVMSHG